MTRKDYILIADAIVEARKEFARKIQVDEIANEMLWSVITELSIVLHRDNIKFNKDKFIDYIEKEIQ